MKAVCVICVALFVAGCGVYSFSSSSLGGVKTVAVPQFENKTVEYGIEGDLTAKVIDRLITDNALKVVALWPMLMPFCAGKSSSMSESPTRMTKVTTSASTKSISM